MDFGPIQISDIKILDKINQTIQKLIDLSLEEPLPSKPLEESGSPTSISCIANTLTKLTIELKLQMQVVCKENSELHKTNKKLFGKVRMMEEQHQ